MRNAQNTRFLTPLSLCLALLCHGCLGPDKNRIVCGACEEPDRFVRLQTASLHGRDGNATGFAHPFRLSPEDWKPILASLHVQAETKPLPLFLDKRAEVPAFTPDEIDYLSATLSKAFARAKPEEWVVFGLSRPGPGKVTEMTTGGWFLEGDRLHFILANYRCAVTMPGIRDLLMNDPLTPNTGASFTLTPGAHQTLVQTSGADRSPLLPSPLELSIAYKPLLLGEPAPSRKAPPSPAPAQAEAQPDRAPPRLSIEERLQTLKRLHEQGLITDEEFRAKKKALLDQL